MYANTAQRVPIPPQEREKMRQYGTNFLTRAFGHTRIVNRLPECIERLEMEAYNKCIDQKTYYNYFQRKLDAARDTILKNHRGQQQAAAAHQQGQQQQPPQHVQQPGYAPNGATHAIQQQQQQQPPPQAARFDANGVMVPDNGGLGAEQGSEQTDDQFADFLGAFVNNNNGGAQQLQQQQQQQQQQLMGQTMYGQQPQQAVPYPQAGVTQQQQQQPIAGNGMPRPQPALAPSAGAVAQMQQQQQLAGKVPGVPQAGTPGMQMGPMPGAYQQPMGAGPMGVAVAPRATGTAPPFSQPPPNGAVLGPHGVAGAGGGSGPTAVMGGGPGALVVDQSMAGVYGAQMGIQPASAVPHGASGMMAMPGQQLPGMMTGIASGHQHGAVGVTGGGGAGGGMGLMPPQQAVHPQQLHPHPGVPAPAAQTQYGVQPASQQDLQKHAQYVQAMQQHQHMQAQHQAAAAAAAAAVVAVQQQQQQQQQQQAAVVAAQQQQQQHQAAAAAAAQMARLASGGVAGPPPPQQSQQQQASVIVARGGAGIRPVGPAAIGMPTGGMLGAGMLAGVQQPSQNQHPQQQQVVAGGASTVVAPYAAAAAAATAAAALVPQQPINGVTAPTALAAAPAALQVPKAAVGVAAAAAPPPAGAANNVANPHNIGIAQGGNAAAPAVGANAEAPNIAGAGAGQNIRQEYWGLVNEIKARMPALTTCLERSNRLHEHQTSDPKAARTRQCLQEAYRRCTIDPSAPEYANLPIHPNVNKVLAAVLHYLTSAGSSRRNQQQQQQTRQQEPTQQTQQQQQAQQQQTQQQPSQQQQQTAPTEAPIGAAQTHGTATAARPAALTPPQQQPQQQMQQQTQQQQQHYGNGGNAAATAGAAGGGIASVAVKQEPVKQEPGVADGTAQNAAATVALKAAVNQANRMAAVAAVAAAHNAKLRAAKPAQTHNTHRQLVGKIPAELAAAHGRLTADAALTSKMERTADSLPAGVDQVTRLLGLLGQPLPQTVVQVYSSRGAANLLNFDGDSLMPSLPPAACAQLTAAAAAIAATGPPRARTVSVCRVAGMSYGTSGPVSIAGGAADARDGAADGGVRRGLSVKGAAANGASLEKVAGGKRKRPHDGGMEGAAGLEAAALSEVKRRRQALEAACQEAEEELGGTVTLRLVEAEAAPLSAAEAGVESEAWLLECAASISSAAADQAAGGTGGPPWKRMRVSVPWGYPDTPPIPTFSSTDPAYTHPYGRAARLHFQTALQAGQVPPQPSLQLLAKTWRDAVARVCNAVRVAETGGGPTAMTAVY